MGWFTNVSEKSEISILTAKQLTEDLLPTFILPDHGAMENSAISLVDV
jgi:hypothetical protein